MTTEQTYCQRKHKHYKHPKPNAIQTPKERRIKYQIAVELTHSPNIARQIRDFRKPKFYQFITNYLNQNKANKELKKETRKKA